MTILVLYGPPAVGKLSVARELAAITRFKVFHNHLRNDIIEQFLNYKHKFFFDYAHKISKVIYEIAVNEKIDLIVTSCYAKGEDDALHKRFLSSMKKKRVRVYHAQLVCDEKELFKRVKHESRREFGKLRHKKSLKSTLKKYDLLSPIPFVENFVVDNTTLSPKKVAKMIKNHFRLK